MVCIFAIIDKPTGYYFITFIREPESMSVRILSFTSIILSVFFISTVDAQELSLQLNTGLMNYAGDLQPKGFTFSGSQLTGGAAAMVRVNHFVLRAGFNYGDVQGDDKQTINKVRNLNFKSAIAEFNGCLQYDIISPDRDSKIIPYVFAGAGIFHFNPYTYYDSVKVYLQPLGTEGEGLPGTPSRNYYKLTDFEALAGLGFMYKLSSNWKIGLEFCSRFLRTDYLDDVSRSYPNRDKLLSAHGKLAVDVSFRGDELDPNLTFPSGKKRGNPQNNDNYYTSVLTVTYTFSKISLFNSGNGGFGHNRHYLDCPKKLK